MSKIDLTTQVQGILPVANGGTGTVDGSVIPQFADNEIPSGVVNGSNAIFTLAHVPNPAGSLMQFVGPTAHASNATLALQGIDYTLTASTVTFGTAPASGSNLRSWYRWNVSQFLQFFREQLQMSESIAFTLPLMVREAFSDQAGITDSLSLEFTGGSSDLLRLSQSLNLFDNMRLSIGKLMFLSDQLTTLSDNFAWAYQLSEVVTDTELLSDSLEYEFLGGSIDTLSLVEKLNLSDSMRLVLSYWVTASEELTLIDRFNFIMPPNIFSDAMTMSDGFAIAY